MTRLVAAAVVLLAAVAAADALRDAGGGPNAEPERRASVLERVDAPGTFGDLVGAETAAPVFASARPTRLRPDGGLIRSRVVRGAREIVGARKIAAAFPGPRDAGPVDIAWLAVAPDGTLVLAVYRFSVRGPVEAAVQLWRQGRLAAAFRVPGGSFRGGLAFAGREGDAIVLFDGDGRPAAVFDFTGRRLAAIPG